MLKRQNVKQRLTRGERNFHEERKRKKDSITAVREAKAASRNSGAPTLGKKPGDALSAKEAALEARKRKKGLYNCRT